ncbi:MAG: ComEC/Rec2 family competence protein, partial [Alistipes sp.]
LTRLPMVRALAPLIGGIVAAEYYTLPTVVIWVGFAGAGALALAARSSLYAVAALLLFGWGMAEVRALPPDEIPRGVRTEFTLCVGDDHTATLTAWRDTQQGRWHTSEVQVRVRTDSTLTLHTGERLVVCSYLNDFQTKYPTYGTLMRRRGYAGQIWLSERQILEREVSRRPSLHAAAAERLQRLALPEKAQALCAAMAVGDRSGLTPELRRAYARSGTSHLLAVSGLHVGIVFLLVNALLWWLPSLRRGHLWRNAAAIALIWLYALTAGLSPSVIRAALMFSALQLSLASASVYVSGNVLAATAFAMLLFRPAYLFDISFQLSFIAVAAILAWAVPLGSALHSRFRGINALTDLLVVGVVAATATAPLVAHTFGIVSLIGVAANLLVIPLASVVVVGSVVWIVLPLPVFAPLLRFVAGTAATGLNAVAEHAAALPYGAFDYTLTTPQTVGIYLCFGLFTLAIQREKPKKTIPLSPC